MLLFIFSFAAAWTNQVPKSCLVFFYILYLTNYLVLNFLKLSLFFPRPSLWPWVQLSSVVFFFVCVCIVVLKVNFSVTAINFSLHWCHVYAMLSRSVMSDSLWPPWMVSQEASLSLRILQTRVLEWVALPSSRRSSQPRDWTQLSCFAVRFFTVWAIKEAIR